MKIGILTYIKSHNYGALLQAIALREVLTSIGHEVTFIDYFPEYHQKMYKIPGVPKKMLFKHPRNYIHLLLNNICQRIRKRNFCKFQHKYINSNLSFLHNHYDVVIYGSDQIWRKQPFINSYNPIYFGKNDIDTNKHISYAASADQAPSTVEDKKFFSELLSHLDKISVREQWLADAVEGMGYHADVVLDPTLLLNASDWERIIEIPKYKGKKYVLFYDLLPNSFEKQEVVKFAQSKKLELITIVGTAFFTKDRHLKTMVGPEHFLSLIKNAEFVLTSSFHGLVFSLIFHVPVFAAFSRNSQRAQALLEAIGYRQLLLEPLSMIPASATLGNIDAALDKLKLKSLEYLSRL